MRWTGMTDQDGGLAVLMQVCRTGEAWSRYACPRALAAGGYHGRLGPTEISMAVMSEAHSLMRTTLGSKSQRQRRSLC